MSIEFNCPYCTAVIRVPDTASGKRGTCPKCATKLLVPVVEIPSQQVLPPAESLSRSSEVELPPAATLSLSELPESSGSEDAVRDPVISPRGAGAKNRGGRKKRGRRRNSGFIVVASLAALAAIVAVLLFVLYEPPARLEGKLAGTRIKNANIAPGVLKANDVDVSATEFSQAVESLRANPLVLTSELVRTEIRGIDNAIEVTVDVTPSSEFVAVDLTDPALKQYVSDNALAFGEQRMRQLRQSATQLVSELAQDGDRRLTNPSALRNAVVLNLLRDGFGYVVDGAAGKLLCPCVYESGSQLWFAVPATTTSFEIRGRTNHGPGQQFPGRYHVTVQGQAETVVFETEAAEDDTPIEQATDEAESADDAMESDMFDGSEPKTQ